MLIRSYFFYTKQVLLFFAFLLFAYVFEWSGGFISVKSRILPVFAPIQRGLYAVRVGVVQNVTDVFAYRQRQESLLVLKSQLQTTLVDQTELALLRQENESLRGLLELPMDSSFRFFPAQVINRHDEAITIMAGTTHGIENGMLVLVSDILYGVIDEASYQTSQMKVLNFLSGEFPVAILHAGTSVPALMSADAEGLLLNGVVMSDVISVGDVVVTRGDAGVIPGVVIGKIQSVIIQDETSVYKSARLLWTLQNTWPTEVSVLVAW